MPTNDGAFWAPEFIDKNRILYSVASNWDDGGPSCTALAVAKKVEEEIIWEDSGAPLTCTTGTPAKTEGGEIEMEAIDPAYIFSPDGKAYLITGGGLIHGTEVNPQSFQPLSGNAQKLDNGNYLATTVGGGGTSLEITPNHEIIWEGKYNLTLPAGAVYRAQRIPGLNPGSFSFILF